MSSASIARFVTVRNPAQADLICPIADCRVACSFSSAAHRVWCARCGWSHRLTPEQTADLVDALAGITDLNLPAYLLGLAAGQPPPPVAGAVTPATGWGLVALPPVRRAVA